MNYKSLETYLALSLTEAAELPAQQNIRRWVKARYPRALLQPEGAEVRGPSTP